MDSLESIYIIDEDLKRRKRHDYSKTDLPILWHGNAELSRFDER